MATCRHITQHVRYQLAYDIAPARLSFDIPAIDRLLVLADRGGICVTGGDGRRANTLVTRACVRALMSRRQGGFGSPSVLFVDAGNCSDIYECVDFARQYGLDSEKILDGIIVSRPFTIHQLARLIIHDLQPAMQRFHAKLVVISDLLQMFTKDPQVDPDEARWLVREIALMVRKLAARSLVIVSITDLPEYARRFLAFFDHQIGIEGTEAKVCNSRHRTARTVKLPERELQVIPAR
jgi:hypothetical protein